MAKTLKLSIKNEKKIIRSTYVPLYNVYGRGADLPFYIIIVSNKYILYVAWYIWSILIDGSSEVFGRTKLHKKLSKSL